MVRVEDSKTITETLDDGQTSSWVEVQTYQADTVRVYVDDGAQGAPPSHDIQYQAYMDEIDDWMVTRDVSGNAARTDQDQSAHSGATEKQGTRVQITDQSGATGNTYRILVKAVIENDTTRVTPYGR